MLDATNLTASNPAAFSIIRRPREAQPRDHERVHYEMTFFFWKV